MAPTYSYVSPEPMQYASPTIAICNDQRYRPWESNEASSVSGFPSVLPVRSPSTENSSWDSLVNHVFYVPQTDLCSSNLSPSYRLVTAEMEPPVHDHSPSPPTKLHRVAQVSCTLANEIPSKGTPRVREGEIRIPTGAPLARQLSASNSLLSPIKLENLTDKANEEMDAPDLKPLTLSRSQSGRSLLNYPLTLLGSTSDERYDGLDDYYADHFTSSDEIQYKAKQRSPVTSNFETASISQLHSERPPFHLPKRQLSYGQIQNNSNHKTLYRSTGSRQLRNQVEIPSEDKPQAFPTSQSSDADRHTQMPSVNYFPSCGKPRPWIHATKHEERIEKAHLTALITPPRPHIITIPRRSSSLEPQKAGPNPAAKSICVSDFTTATPPETPVTALRLKTMLEGASDPENEIHTSAGLYGNGRVPLTPPNSPTQTPRPSTFLPQKIIRSGSKSLSYFPNRCETTSWILDELEMVVANFPKVMLLLDSPAIQHLRQRQLAKPSSKCPKVSQVPAPHSRYSTRSRYSIFRPLSSHPSKGRHAEAPENPEPRGPPSSPLGHSKSDSSAANPALNALQTIFPHARISTLECLQATYVALNHLFALCHPPTPKTQSPAAPMQPECLISLVNVPPKAREMLGMQTSTVVDPAHGFSWFRSEMPEQGDDGPQQARIKSLAARLNGVARNLLGSIEGRRLDCWDEAFVRTVGEVVRLGESRSGRSMLDCRREPTEEVR